MPLDADSVGTLFLTIASMLALAVMAAEQDHQPPTPQPSSFSIRRDVRESDGTTVRIFSDGSALLTVVFNRNERVVDCTYLSEKSASQAVSWLFYEALVCQADGNNTAYFADVKRIYRRCKRQLREALDNVSAEEHKEATVRKQLKDGFEAEAPWCSFHDPDVPAIVRPSAEDTCCKTLRNCSMQIGGFQRKYDLFNYHSEPAFACSCAAEFAACLRAAASPLARRLLDAYVGSGAVKCLTLDESHEQCEQYDELYARCLKKARVARAHFAPLPSAAGGGGGLDFDASANPAQRVGPADAEDGRASANARRERTDDRSPAGLNVGGGEREL